MARVVEFYSKLPRGNGFPRAVVGPRMVVNFDLGPAPAPKASGLIGRYKAKYFSGDKTSPMRTSL